MKPFPWPAFALGLAACTHAHTPPGPAPEALCHYESWHWSTAERRAVNKITLEKKRAELTREETGEIPGCTVCSEDQAELRLDGLPGVLVCRALLPRFRAALEAAVRAGFPVRSLVGYRVGRSKGDPDARGLRTQFSNHSYGIALDVNAEANGLYDHCLVFGRACRRLRGGPYHPGSPGAITSGSPMHRSMRENGFLWGGEIQGNQKDFMHFSPSGR